VRKRGNSESDREREQDASNGEDEQNEEGMAEWDGREHAGPAIGGARV